MRVAGRFKSYHFIARWPVAGVTALLVGLSGPVATAQQSAFDQLTAPSSFMEKRVEDGKRAFFTVEGTAVRFAFRRDGRFGAIQILCSGGVSPCGDMVDLIGERATGGDFLFRTKAGIPVLRVTSAGSGTLFGGADFVPKDVPKKGAPFVRG